MGRVDLHSLINLKFRHQMKALQTATALLILSINLTAQPKEADYYPIIDIPLPEGENIEVSGIDVLPDNRIAISSRRGDIWIADGAYSATSDNPPTWSLFARGLHEVLGIAWKDGWLYLTQRPEVSRIKDSDGDGRADIFETLGDGWGINGDYHEYAFGTRHDKEGNIWVVLCLTFGWSR